MLPGSAAAASRCTVTSGRTVCAAEMVIINGRGIVQYNFEATVDEELTVDRGEQVTRTKR